MHRRLPFVAILVVVLSILLADLSSAMDLVRAQTGTDAAAAIYGVSGDGVVIAILDRGIDWEHPDFRNPDGSTRIKWLVDMTGQSWCNSPNQPYVEYSEAQINAALSGGPTIPSRDAVGHGTTTTGIAAGNGRAAAGGKYRGMAPGADLIVIKMTSDGVPAHDGEPAESFFVACIDDALDILDAKLTAMGDPPVVGLINSGTQWGPIDGTSAVSRKIDEVFGANRPGRVYVSASGDEAWHDSHAGGDFNGAGSTQVSFYKNSTAGSWMQMWYSGDRPANATVTFASGASATAGPGEYVTNAGIELLQQLPGQEGYPWTSTSGDRSVWMYSQGSFGPGTITISGLTPGTGRFDLYSDFDGVVTFDDHVVPGRLTDYSATQSAIVIASHVVRTLWIDINGIPRAFNSEGLTGELWQGSSAGPTRDGRPYGVDLSAPGHNVFTAYSQDSYWATFESNLVQDGLGWYGRAGATSGSAPVIVGAAALMLERNPNLTGNQVRQILRDTATPDGDTGAVPNLDWGFGKLDMLAALDATPVPSGAVPTSGQAGLQITKLGAGFMLLSWSDSCLLDDDDYEIYEGTLGDFQSHIPVICSTLGSTQYAVQTPADDRYYIVVPRNDSREGSHGMSSEGIERSQGPNACLARDVDSCP